MLHISLGFTIYCCAVVGLLGACMGSFLNCCAWRIVHGEKISRGRSHCDACGHVLGPGDLIPVFSFLFARGKCRYCGQKLSPRHLLAEILGAAGYVSILLKFDLSLQALQMLIFVSILLAASLADLEGMIIPDRFILIGLASGLAFPIFTGGLAQAVIGGVSVAGVLLIVVLIFEKVMKKEAMGGGDIKLLAVTGLHLGWMCNILCVLLACIFGIIFGLMAQKRDEPLPWGPSIALAAWLCCLFGNELIEAYLGLLT